MMHPDQLGHLRDLLSPIQIHREIAGSPSERKKIYGGDNDLALRNDQAVLPATIDEAGNSISKIASNNCIDIETSQAGNVRKKRLGIEQIHVKFPLTKARKHQTTPATKRANSISYNRFRAASCPVLTRYKLNSLLVLADDLREAEASS